jgi:hypothetical protein
MADVGIIKFGEVDIYTVYGDDHKALALDDIAVAIGLLTGDQLRPLIDRLGLDWATYNTPLVPRGKVEMMMVDGVCEMLRAYGGEGAERLAVALADPSSFDRLRYNGKSPEQIRRLRISDAVARIRIAQPNATSDAIALQLEIAPEEVVAEFWAARKVAAASSTH